MDICSNRGETKQEMLGRFAKEVSNAKRIIHTFDWQIGKGAEIRGKLGVNKGNQFIQDMSKY